MVTLKRSIEFFHCLLAATLLGAIVASPSLCVAAEQKIALVVGNSAYPSSRLRNPVNDAKAMADKLKSLGFDVILRTDSNLRDMTRSFSQFGQKLTPGSVGLFYYAGHGMQVRGKNYLIPIDAEIENEASVSSEAVDVDQLLNQLGPARLSMVILDACRNNPFERRFRAAVSGGLAQIDAPTGTMLAYATAPGKVASDGTGANGLYTEALLKALDTPGLKVEDVFKQVRINVVKASDGTQTPWESSSLTGEFYFKSPVAIAVDDAALKKADQERAALARELADERMRRDKDAELIRAEMEKLRAELLKMRNDAVAQAAVTKIAAAPAAAPAAPALPVPPQLPAAKPAVAPAPLASAAAQKPAAATPTPPVQIALAAPSAPPPTPPTPQANAAEWAQRVALLEQSKGKLSFPKAMAILLDISSETDLTLLIDFEKTLRARRAPSAMTMGVTADGELVWVTAWNWRRAQWAYDATLENCAKAGAAKCNLVLQETSFDEIAVIALAKQLGARSIATVRTRFMLSLANPAARFNTPIVNGGNAWVDVSKL